jgi:hypothetical protein
VTNVTNVKKLKKPEAVIDIDESPPAKRRRRSKSPAPKRKKIDASDSDNLLQVASTSARKKTPVQNKKRGTGTSSSIELPGTCEYGWSESGRNRVKRYIPPPVWIITDNQHQLCLLILACTASSDS